jgi:uncharacterized membrane protein
VTTEACVEFEGSGTNRFHVTIYNRDEFPVVFDLNVNGQASQWASVPASTRIEGQGTQLIYLDVDVPEGTEPGLYNLSLDISSGGELILTRALYVSVAEITTISGENQTVVEIINAPTGAFIVGGVDLLWVLIGVIVIVNILLLVILVKKRRA